MKHLALIPILLAIPLAVFGWWGTFTATGHMAYDEMDGLYPAGAGVLAIILVIASAAASLVARHLKIHSSGKSRPGFQVVRKSDSDPDPSKGTSPAN